MRKFVYDITLVIAKKEKKTYNNWYPYSILRKWDSQLSTCNVFPESLKKYNR